MQNSGKKKKLCMGCAVINALYKNSIKLSRAAEKISLEFTGSNISERW